jgi:hypothetical protein
MLRQPRDEPFAGEWSMSERARHVAQAAFSLSPETSAPALPAILSEKA